MKKVPMVLLVGVLFLISSVGLAEMTPEKALLMSKVDAALSAYNSGQVITPAQHELLKRHSLLDVPAGELDNLGGPDAFGYSFVDSNEPDGPVFDWVDVSETGTEVTNWADDINLGPFDIGFDFPFYGEMYTQFWVCSNGWLTFSAGMGTTYTNRSLPDAPTPNNAIYWSWDDWTPVGADVAWYGLDDDGNCVFQCGFAVDGPGTLDSEVILYPDGTIKLQYGPNFSIRNNSSTIGIENLDGTIGLQVVYNNNVDYPSPEMAIQFELLDMGFVAGQVTDLTSLEPVPGAEVTLLTGDAFFRSTFADEEGMYSMLVEIGDYNIFASAFGYLPSEPEPVTVILDETVAVDIGIDRAPAPEIFVDPEALEFVCAWMGTDSDIMTVSNIGGDNLDWYTSVEFVEEEVAQELRQAKPWPAPFQIPMNLVLPDEEDYQGVPAEKVEYYENVKTAYNTLKNNIPLNLEQRELLGQEGILPHHGELDQTAEDEFGYILTDSEEPDCPEFDWIDISETGELVAGLADDNFVGPFELPFEFPFYDNVYSEIFLGSNGILTFGEGSRDLSNDPMPSTALPNNVIAFFWDDLNIMDHGSAYIGLDPDGNWVCQLVEYEEFSGNSGRITCQTILYPNGAIKMQYLDLALGIDINGESIGLENADGTVGIQAALNAEPAGYPYNELVILFHLGEYTGGWLGLDPSNGTLAPQAEQEVIVTADASIGELGPGTYEAIITVATDYPNVDPVAVWATMTVLDPGTISGQVYDSETLEGLAGAMVYRWVDGEIVEEIICDELGNYSFPVGEGMHILTADMVDYYANPEVEVDVLEGEVTVQNFALVREVPPTITLPDAVLEEGIFFEIEWGVAGQDVITLSNDGGLPLNWESSITYIEEEEVARFRLDRRIRQEAQADPEAVLARRRANIPQLTVPDWNLQEATPGVVIDPDYTPAFELDEGPYLVMTSVNISSSILAALDNLEIEYTYIATNSWSTVDLTEYGTLISGHDGGAPTAADAQAAIDFMAQGGTFMYFGGTSAVSTALNANGVVNITGTGWQTSVAPHINIIDPGSNLASEVEDGYTFTNNSASYSYFRYADDDEADIAIQNGNGQNILLAKEYESGMFIAFANSPYYFYWQNPADLAVLTTIVDNMINYTGTGWLTLDPEEGHLEVDESVDITLTVDAVPDSLFAGVYEALVEITGDHWALEPVEFWVTMQVNGGPPLHHFIGTEDIPLMTNYFELVSTYLDPVRFPSDAMDLFGPVPGFEIAYEDNGSIYVPGGTNTIEDIDITQGYRIFLSPVEEGIQTIHVMGDPIDPILIEYNMTANIWNWIGYPFNYEVPVEAAFGMVADDIRIVMNDEGEFWIPGLINTMGMMTPGEGYLVIPAVDINFVYDIPVMAAPLASDVWSIPEVEEAAVATGLPYPVLVSLTEDIEAYQPATIEIYDGKVLVGKAVVLDDRDFTPVVAWEGSADHNLAGFVAGNEMTIVVKASNGSIIPSVVEASPQFGEGAYASVTVGGNAVPTEFTVSHGYPNPFNPSVTVPIALPTAGEVNFTVFNVLGQEVLSLSKNYEVGHHKFMFNAGNELVSGVYFLQVDFNKQIHTQKLMLLK